jgi:hypothetical protein
MAPDVVSATVSDALRTADAFVACLRGVKAEMPDVSWYPHDTLSSLPLICTLTEGVGIPLNNVLDVGAGDGDLSVFFAGAGASVDALDNTATNFNKGDGLRRLNEAFGGRVSITFADIDLGFTLQRQYDLCLALGIAYHLRNPLLVYTTLAQHCRFMLTNTRVIDVLPNRIWSGRILSGLATWLHRLRGGSGVGCTSDHFAYFAERREINNDPTNYWLFSPAAYRRVLNRCGWRILREASVGASLGTVESDKRMWVLCERVPNHADLRLHHDF